MTEACRSADVLRDGDDFWVGSPLSGERLRALLAELDCGAPGDDELRPDPQGAWRFYEPGGLSRPGGAAGAAFVDGGVAADMAPGLALASLADEGWEQRERVSDDELIGIIQAWRRLSGWVAARELAALAELEARRESQVKAGADPHLAEHVADEVAAALTLTVRAAGRLMDLAAEMGRLPATAAALESGRIDRERAAVIADETRCLSPGHAAAVEAAVIGEAPGQTSGQLRAAVRRAVLAADPEAADRRRKEALREARVETWDEQSGTAALAGRDLPPAQVLAADRRIDGFARRLKQAGAAGTLPGLRARVFTALLLGVPLQVLQSQLCRAGQQPAAAEAGRAAEDGRSAEDGCCDEDGDVSWPDGAAAVPDSEPGGSWAGPLADLLPGLPGLPMTGSLNLTLPVTTWLGGDAPGEAAGFGPLPGSDVRALARLLAAQPGTRLCLTLTGADGTAVGHGCLRTRAPSGRAGKSGGGSSPGGRSPGGRGSPDGGSPPGSGDKAPELTFTIRPLVAEVCDHSEQTASYRPGDRLRHLVVVQQCRCSFPGCRAPATRCDQDHTIPYHKGGRTCLCNLSPLCRRHHQAKQAEGWKLSQPEPGVLIWTLPHGRSYRIRQGHYPAGEPCAGGP